MTRTQRLLGIASRLRWTSAPISSSADSTQSFGTCLLHQGLGMMLRTQGLHGGWGQQSLLVSRLSSSLCKKASRPWSSVHAKVQSRFTAVINGLSLSTSGQKLLLTMGLPVAVSQLFPGSTAVQALSVAPSTPEWRAQQTKPQSQLLPKFSMPTMLLRLAEELQVVLRGLYLSLLFFPALASAPLAFWLGGVARQAWMQLMTSTLERAGPAFVKWGQWSSTRPDLFPPDLCSALERLQSSAPSHPATYSYSAIEKSLNAPVHELFDSFESEPVASGSIAQIHRASLSARGAARTAGKYKPGTVVAVKVRHPGVIRLMEHDFVLMERAARLLSTLPGIADLRLEESLRQFGGPLKEQLDLKAEAQHLRRFRHNFRLWPNVSFPAPLDQMVSSDVLVETFEDGALISKYVNQPTYAHRGALAETGLTCYLQMLLRDNFIHADLHPGNILVREPSQPELFKGFLGWLQSMVQVALPPKLVLLDTGMIAELSKPDQAHLISFFRALTKHDGEQLGHAILEMSERYTCKNPEAFVGDMIDMFDRLDAEYIHKHTANVIQSIIDTIREHQVTLRSTISTVVVTTLVLEGWSNKLNPDMHILDFIRDMLVTSWGERISKTVDNLVTHGSLAIN